MNVKITVTADDSNVYEGEVDLVPVGAARIPRRSAKAAAQTVPKVASPNLDFTVNARAFVKAHARGLSGLKKFVLLLSYLAKGKVGEEVELKSIQKHWNKMTAPTLLGCKFNTFYSNTAKDNGWVNTRKTGVYVLASSWKKVLEN